MHLPKTTFSNTVQALIHVILSQLVLHIQTAQISKAMQNLHVQGDYIPAPASQQPGWNLAIPEYGSASLLFMFFPCVSPFQPVSLAVVTRGTQHFNRLRDTVMKNLK